MNFKNFFIKNYTTALDIKTILIFIFVIIIIGIYLRPVCFYMGMWAGLAGPAWVILFDSLPDLINFLIMFFCFRSIIARTAQKMLFMLQNSCKNIEIQEKNKEEFKKILLIFFLLSIPCYLFFPVVSFLYSLCIAQQDIQFEIYAVIVLILGLFYFLFYFSFILYSLPRYICEKDFNIKKINLRNYFKCSGFVFACNVFNILTVTVLTLFFAHSFLSYIVTPLLLLNCSLLFIQPCLITGAVYLYKQQNKV